MTAPRRNAMRLPALGAALLLAAGLAGCSTEAEMHAVDPSGSGSDTAVQDDAPRPTGIPAADGPVATDGLVTVLDAGAGAQLCTSVAESLPPQCQGAPLAGWDWAAHPEHEEQSGVRWGMFALTGTFDGDTLTVTDAVPAALYDPAATAPDPGPGIPCDAPAGGWAPLDAATTTPEAMDATLTAASALPDLALTWVAPIDGGDDAQAAPTEPAELVLNVAVTDDVAAAEARLRQTWGGALCVSEAEHTERELGTIQDDLGDLPGLESSGVTEPDRLDVRVLFDDGSYQAWADREYGPGLVAVSSTLVPVAG